MSDKSRQIIVIAVDIAAWGVTLWLMAAAEDPMAKARLHRSIATASRCCAAWFGQRAINAELRYMREVRSL